MPLLVQGEASELGPRVRVGGRATNLGLGQYPLVELAEARAKALENARAVAAGRDPRTSAAPTFEEAAQEVIRLRIPCGCRKLCRGR